MNDLKIKIFNLILNGTISSKEIAVELNIPRQNVNYYLKLLLKDSAIKKVGMQYCVSPFLVKHYKKEIK